MDPTPNETEMREATEWCTKFVLNSGDHPYPINAYAAALAKCREAIKFMQVLKRRHNGYSRDAREAMPGLEEPKTPDQAIDELITEAEELATVVERERCAKIALITRIKLIGLDNLNSVALAKKNVQAMREAIAAAIRGGGQ